jgi:hypothetical protein
VKLPAQASIIADRIKTAFSLGWKNWKKAIYKVAKNNQKGV